MSDVFYINDIPFKVQAVTPTAEPIWSSNAGRSSTGKMVGDIVAWKNTVQVTFCPMNDQKSRQYYNAVHRRAYTVKFVDPGTGTLKEITCYGIPVEMPVYSYVEGYPRYTGVSASFVEE